jgi:CubicO group peptidase (beta-lactamase class C family)
VDALDRLVREAIARSPVVGLSVLVARRSDVLLSAGYGLANAEYGIPMTPRTLSRAASITKTMTATLVLRLMQQGRIALDAPLADFIPAIRPDLATATVRDLLTHRSGLPHGMDETLPLPARNETLASFTLDYLPHYALGPRGVYAYSNPGYAVLGHVAEVAGEAPYLELMQREVLDPLRMSSTTFEPSVALTYGCAASHGGDGTVSHRFFDYPGRYPAGFAFTHVEDLLGLANVLTNRSYLLDPETRAHMQTPQADCGDGRWYGLGVLVEERDGRRRVGHTGYVLDYASRLDTAPDEGIAVAMLFNQSTFRDEARDLADRLIAAAS